MKQAAELWASEPPPEPTLPQPKAQPKAVDVPPWEDPSEWDADTFGTVI